MSRFNTGNPVGTSGSNDPRDFNDNMEMLDQFVNDTAAVDRLSRNRATIQGIENQASNRITQAVLSAGYQHLGDYASGMVISASNQLVKYDGEYWKAAASVELPFTTTNWSADSIKFVAVGDAVLRGELNIIPRTFNTVAEMKADTTLVSGSPVTTLRYHSAGDGQARYLIQTSAEYGSTPDEYGNHTLANGNVAVLQVEGAVNVRQFGAKGDGVSDDTAAIQAAFGSLLQGQKLVIPRTSAGTVYMVSGDIKYPSGIEVESNNKVLLRAIAGSSPTKAMLYSELVDIDATTAEFQSKKFDCKMVGVHIDMANAVSGHGIWHVGDRVYFEQIYIESAPWCGIYHVEQGLNGTVQAAGLNMLHSYYNWVRVRAAGVAFRNTTNVARDKSTGIFIGTNQNGRLTDGFINNIAVVSANTGIFIGSSAGWHGTNFRLANVDDGFIASQPVRTNFTNVQIDDFGRGFDTAKESFVGISSGRMLTARSHARWQGQVQSAQQAGTDAGKTYVAFRTLNPTSGIEECSITADIDSVLLFPGVSSFAKSIGFEQESFNQRNFSGKFTGVVRNASQLISAPSDTKILNDVQVVLTQNVNSSEHRLTKTDIESGLAAPIFAITQPGQGGGLYEVTIFVHRNLFYVTGVCKYIVQIGRSSLGTGVRVGILETSALQTTSQSAGVRNITDLVFTSAVVENVATFSTNATFSGSGLDTTYDLTCKIEAISTRSVLEVSSA